MDSLEIYTLQVLLAKLEQLIGELRTINKEIKERFDERRKN
jgi:hypothetical protein